jgi:hypothetical protein
MIQINPDKKSAIKSVFSSSQKTFPDYFKGSIVKVSDIEFGKKQDHMFKKNYNEYCSIEGDWTNSIKFNNQKYWAINDYKQLPFYQPEYKLKSDSSLRDDILYLLQGNIDESQKYKELYDETQRHDRKLREEYSKKINKK